MRKNKRLFGILTLLIVFSGCATTRQFAPVPDQSVPIENTEMARIYVLRPALVGAAVKMRVTDGDTVIGKTGPQSYLCWEREAGTTIIAGHAETGSKLSLTVEAGKTYYIKQAVRPGFVFARNKLTLLSEDEGLDLLKKCKPAQ